jgi:hypothetical protein
MAPGATGWKGAGKMAASRSYASHQTEVVMNGHNRLFSSDPIGYINGRAITPCVRKDVASIFLICVLTWGQGESSIMAIKYSKEFKDSIIAKQIQVQVLDVTFRGMASKSQCITT